MSGDMQKNNSVLPEDRDHFWDLDRNDPDRIYRYVGVGISTRPDENCGKIGGV